MQYFKGKPGDRGCLLCPQVSQTNAEFAKHLWTHKETEAGRTIKKNERYSLPYFVTYCTKDLITSLALDRENVLIPTVKAARP